MDNPMMDQQNSDAEPDASDQNEPNEGSDVTEEYISSAQKALSKTIPEDFSPVDVQIPTDAKDGERVAMIITGYAEGGKLTGAYGASLDLSEPKPKGRMMQMLNSKEA
jgi:hypothetical protein